MLQTTLLAIMKCIDLSRPKSAAVKDIDIGKGDIDLPLYHTYDGSVLVGALTTYRKYLQRVLGGDWLAFPRRLFNDTASVVMGERAVVLPADADLLGTEANFGAFVEVEEIENVQLWPVQFWQRSEQTY